MIAHFEKKKDLNHAYKFDGVGGYSCTDCNSRILMVRVSHTIKDGISSVKDSDHYENVLYCPICEEEPNEEGRVIRYP